MFVSSEKRSVPSFGSGRSGKWTEENAAMLEVVGGVFRGDVRALEFHEGGDLLVVAGLGVRRFDPDTFEEKDAWLAGVHVQCVRRCDARLWVVVGDEVFLAEYGAPLGGSLATIDTPQLRETFTSGGGRFAAPEERGVCVVGSDGKVDRFTFDEAWYEDLWHKRRPSRALLSPNGRYVAASADFSSYSVVWDVETGEWVGASTSYESMAVLDDGRLIKADEESSSYFDLRTDGWGRIEGTAHMSDAFVRGERLLGANSRGQHVVLDATSLEVTGEGAGYDQAFGSGTSSVLGAVSATHVATYAAKQGVITVSSGSGQVESGGWHGSAQALSVSDDGSKIAVWREWNKGRLDCVDREHGTIFEVTDTAREGITNACITRDGVHIVAPCGSILRARTVAVGPFDGDTSEGLQKIKSCVHQTLPYGAERYAIATYTLQGAGLVGLYKAGSKRAVAKLTHQKEQARHVAVGHGQTELLVVWDSATILYDMTKRPKVIDTIPHSCMSIALGPQGFLAHLNSSGEEGRSITVRTPDRPDVVVTVQREGRTFDRLAFSADGALLFVGASDGTLEVRRTSDCEVLASLPLHAGGFVDVLTAGDTVWTMGKDGVVCAVGVPE